MPVVFPPRRHCVGRCHASCGDCGGRQQPLTMGVTQRKSKKAAQRRSRSNSSTNLPGHTGEQAACRICLAGEQEGEPLLRPCRCDGSMRWVHSGCVVEWLRLNPAAPLSCEICGEAFDVVFSGDGQPLGLGYFDCELDDPELEDSGLLTVFLIAFTWMNLMLFVESTIYASGLLPLQIFSGRDWFWMVVDMAMAIIYNCCIVFKMSILIAGGADWQPEDWGALFAWTDIFFEAIEVFLADFGLGLRFLSCLVGAVSVKSIFTVAMNHPLQRCHNYCGPHAVMLSSTVNLIALAWMLKRAFLDQQPLVSEVKGEFLRSSSRRRQDYAEE